MLAPLLEESLFRGCLFPLIAQSTGNAVAIILTAGAFALFHGLRLGALDLIRRYRNRT